MWKRKFWSSLADEAACVILSDDFISSVGVLIMPVCQWQWWVFQTSLQIPDGRERQKILCSEEDFWGHPDQTPESPRLAPLIAEEQLSELLNPISEAKPNCPVVEIYFGCLYSWSHSSGHYQQLMTISDVWDVDWSVKWERHLPGLSQSQQTSV